MDILHSSDMTSAQRESYEQTAPDFIQVDFLDGQFARIFFANEKLTTDEILRRYGTNALHIWSDQHIVVDVVSFDASPTAHLNALRLCERKASR